MWYFTWTVENSQCYMLKRKIILCYFLWKYINDVNYLKSTLEEFERESNNRINDMPSHEIIKICNSKTHV